MRVLLSLHGKAALEISGKSIIKFLTVGPLHPIFDSAPRDSFYKEYNTVSNMTVDEALFSFLRVAKRAYKHSPEVCSFIWSYFMGKNFSEMSADELLFTYNRLARSLNKSERKAFSSKAEAITAIEKLDNLVVEPTPVQLKHEAKMTEIVTNEAGESVTVATPKKPRGKGIGKRAMELILEGKTNQEAIEIIQAEIEDAHPTVATMAWYRNKLRQEGKLPKVERKAKAKKDEPEVEAQEEEAQEAQEE